MLLKSEYHEEEISVKTLLLRKGLKDSLTSEEYFKIPKQPGNTCPIIDRIIDLLMKKETDIFHLLNKYSRLTESSKSSKNLLALKGKIEELESLSSKYHELSHHKLEDFRNDCQLKRDVGDTLKDLMWKHIEGKNISKDYDDLDLEVEDTFFMEDCSFLKEEYLPALYDENGPYEEEVMEALSTLNKVEINDFNKGIIALIETAFLNKDEIVKWSNNLFNKMEELLNSRPIIDVETLKSQYLKDRNDLQKEKLKEFLALLEKENHNIKDEEFEFFKEAKDVLDEFYSLKIEPKIEEKMKDLLIRADKLEKELKNKKNSEISFKLRFIRESILLNIPQKWRIERRA